MFRIRKSSDRGFAKHGWLKSFHTFSFADYFDRNHMHFGNLRVINEDWIAGGSGFGEHPHRDMEIITYIISGALKHQDSLGNSSIILPGEVQVMSAGTGVLHSEFNQEKDRETHLLQIWILPQEKGITPRYEQKSFKENFAEDGLTLVVSNFGRNGSLVINQDAEIFVGKFSASKKEIYTIKPGRKIWIQMIVGKLAVNDVELENGDAVAIEKEDLISIKAEENSEFLLFDL